MEFEMFIESIWFMLPAYAATIIPFYARKINFLNYPINRKIFGENKTYRGFFFGISWAIFIAYLQVELYKKYFVVKALSIVFYDQINYLLFGFLLGFGTLFGDLIKSFFKRRLKIKEGKSWFPFDNIDYVIGALFFVSFVYVPPTEHIILIILLSGLLHFIFERTWIALKWR
jgi:CDP-2,3-bis-(O-geranylgeranyl)-sn-glycerol synthase